MLINNYYKKKAEARTAQKESLEHIPPHITNAFSEFSSPADLLLLTPPAILAEQLTLIDYAIFKDIEVRLLIINNDDCFVYFYFFSQESCRIKVGIKQT